MINNRQNGRRRGRGGQQQVRGGQPGAQDRGSRIDNRARGNAAQLHEKYKTLARDAQMQGDRVNTEYYLQFADHYFRVLSETRNRFDEQRPRPQNEYGDEGEGDGQMRGFDRQGDADDGDSWDDEQPYQQVPAQPPRQQQQQPERQPQQPQQPQQQARPRRDEGQRSSGDQRYGNEGRGNESRGNEGRSNEGRGNDARPNGDYRPNGETRANPDPQQDQRRPGSDAPPAGNGRAYGDERRADQVNDAREEQPAVAAPRPRGRPRRVAPVVDGDGATAGGDDAAPARIEIDRIPPSLSAEPAAGAAEDGEALRPRRRPRRPRESVPVDA